MKKNYFKLSKELLFVNWDKKKKLHVIFLCSFVLPMWYFFSVVFALFIFWIYTHWLVEMKPGFASMWLIIFGSFEYQWKNRSVSCTFHLEIRSMYLIDSDVTFFIKKKCSWSFPTCGLDFALNIIPSTQTLSRQMYYFNYLNELGFNYFNIQFIYFGLFGKIWSRVS